jgi:hypothetical protein
MVELHSVKKKRKKWRIDTMCLAEGRGNLSNEVGYRESYAG